MESEYQLVITEKIQQPNYRTPAISYEDAQYWANRIIELGSKGVSIWRNGDFLDVLSPKSKETE